MKHNAGHNRQKTSCSVRLSRRWTKNDDSVNTPSSTKTGKWCASNPVKPQQKDKG